VLTGLGVRFKVLDPCHPQFIAELAGFDIALPNLHGPFGEDGRLQGLLDYLRTPCCGSGVAASAIAADKIVSKQMMQALGIPTPAWRTWPGPNATWPGYPVMVKPRMGGSSVGMTLARDQHDLPAALATTSPVFPGRCWPPSPHTPWLCGTGWAAGAWPGPTSSSLTLVTSSPWS
jgi:D-alanine-D-alanine ligase